MAISLYVAKLIKQVLAAQSESSRRAAMFSCHDLLIQRRDITDVFGLAASRLPYRKDSHEIVKWHKMGDRLPGVVDTHDAFREAWWSLDAFDVVQARGKEIIKDLNEPFTSEYLGQYDFVFDNILGQVFNVAQAMRSAVELLKVGGYLVSVTPANAPNHGFYSISPTFYHDVLTQNGFTITHQTVVDNLTRGPAGVSFRKTTGCRLPYGSSNVVVAQRVTCKPFRYPTQSKFVQSPNSTIK